VHLVEHGGDQPEQGVVVGEDLDASVRRLISRLIRSSGLVDWIFFQCRSGKTANAVRSSFASSSICLTLGNWPPNMSATVSTWALTAIWPGWAKIVRIVAATISPASFGITPKTFRRKWTLHLW
jgi:hypothetical protein